MRQNTQQQYNHTSYLPRTLAVEKNCSCVHKKGNTNCLLCGVIWSYVGHWQIAPYTKVCSKWQIYCTVSQYTELAGNRILFTKLIKLHCSIDLYLLLHYIATEKNTKILWNIFATFVHSNWSSLVVFETEMIELSELYFPFEWNVLSIFGSRRVKRQWIFINLCIFQFVSYIGHHNHNFLEKTSAEYPIQIFVWSCLCRWLSYMRR